MENKPKKRGRKPKISKETEPDTETEIIEKKEPEKVLKKRGRKPKPKTEEDLLPKIPKKRGRKPKEKTYGTNHNKFKIDEDHIILHLKVHTNDLMNNNDGPISILKYNPKLSEPTGYLEDNIHTSEPEIINNIPESNLDTKINNKEITGLDNVTDKYEKTNFEKDDVKKISLNYKDLLNSEESIIKNKSIIVGNKKITNTLTEFLDINKQSKWPETTNIHCWWCCHQFKTPPCALPYKKIRDVFHVKGCFCSYNCAASYNFDSTNDDNIWERYSLLNLLYKISNNTNDYKIKLAPPRESLKIFGGHMTVDDFRKSNLNNNIECKVFTPPLVSIISQIEETKNNNIGKDNYIPIDKNKINKASTTLKLRRNKPLQNSQNTLESCMGLKTI